MQLQMELTRLRTKRSYALSLKLHEVEKQKRNGTTSAPEDLTVTLEYFLNSSDSFTLVFVFISLITAYVIFGIAGFGAALIAAPVLVHRIPVANRLNVKFAKRRKRIVKRI